MTEAEAKAVINLWTQRQSKTPQPTTADVAEGLDIPIEQVQMLLRQVRGSSQSQGEYSQKHYGLDVEATNRNFKILATMLAIVGGVGAFTLVVTVWVTATVFILSPADHSPLLSKLLIGSADAGLLASTLLAWDKAIQYFKRNLRRK